MKNKDFFKSLSALAANLRQVIEAEVDGFDPSPKAVAARREKVFDPVGGYEYVVNTYFPHYIRSQEKSLLEKGFACILCIVLVLFATVPTL